MNFTTGMSGFVGIWAFFAIGIVVVQVILHILFALAVLTHSGQHPRTVLVGGATWALATLIGGPLVGAAYWVANSKAMSASVDADPAPVETIAVPSFECRSCRRISVVATVDGRCVHCGTPTASA